MAFLSDVQQSAARPSAWSVATSWLVSACEIFAASVRAANAVEAHRHPRAADLRKLGIVGRLPLGY